MFGTLQFYESGSSEIQQHIFKAHWLRHEGELLNGSNYFPSLRSVNHSLGDSTAHKAEQCIKHAHVLYLTGLVDLVDLQNLSIGAGGQDLDKTRFVGACALHGK